MLLLIQLTGEGNLQLREQADEVRELFRTLIQLHARRGAVKVGFGPL